MDINKIVAENMKQTDTKLWVELIDIFMEAYIKLPHYGERTKYPIRTKTSRSRFLHKFQDEKRGEEDADQKENLKSVPIYTFTKESMTGGCCPQAITTRRKGEPTG